MPLAVLSIDIEAKLAKFEQQMGAAARTAEKNAEASRAAWARAGAGLSGLIGGAVGLFAGYNIVDALRQNIDFLDSLNDMQDATGASIEKLSGLVDLAERTGTTLDVAETALVKLNAALNDTDPNSTSSRALKQIGLDAAELRRMDPVDALHKVAKALAGFADDGDKARFMQELLGKSARELAPLLKDLGEKGELNGKFTKQQAEEAEKFNKALSEFKINSAEAARSLAASMLPALNEFAQQLLVARREYGNFWDALIDQGWSVDPMKSTNETLTETAQQIAKIRAEIEKTQSMRGGWLLGNDAADADLKSLREQLRLLEARERVLRQQQARDGAGAGRGLITPLNIGDGDKKSVGTLADKVTPKKAEIDDASRALSAYIDQLQRQLDATVELTEQQKALDLLKSLGATGEVDQVRELVLGMADKLQKLKDEEELEKAVTAELERQAKARKDLDDALDQYSGRVEAARKRALTERLEQRLNSGETFSPEELERIVKGIAGLGDQSKETFDEMGEFAKKAAANIQDALGSSLEAMFEGSSSNILDIWANMLKKMAAQALAAQLGKYLLGDFDKTGSVGGAAGDAWDWVKNTWSGGSSDSSAGSLLDLFSSFGGSFFAEGGDHLGGLRVVGERGPELEATGPARIWNFNQTQALLRGGGGGSGGQQLSVHAPVYIQAGMSRAEVAQLIPTITANVEARVAQSIRRPGSRLRN